MNLRNDWRRYFQRERWDAERALELEAHIALETDENIARGMSPQDAHDAARRKLGNETKIREDIYRMNSVRFLDTLWQDVKYGARTLRKSPGYTFVAVLSLALGIGANTAIFSLIDAVMLRTVPVKNPSNLYVLGWRANIAPNAEWMSSFGDCGSTDNKSKPAGCSFPKPVFEKIREKTDVFSRTAAFAGPTTLILSGNGPATEVSGTIVSGDYFSTLEVNPAIGRMLSAGDDTPAASPAVVFTYAFWQSNFGGAVAVVGRTIKLNGVPFTIAGVAERSFTNLIPGKSQDLWIPRSMAARINISWATRSEGLTNWWLVVIGRLRPDVTQAQAESAATLIFRDQVIHGEKALAKERDNPTITLAPVQAGLTGRRSVYSTRLYVLMCGAGIILLIACANLAGLLLARAAARQREIGLRLALGAGRGRLVQQLLTESVLLSASGGALGIVFAYWGVHAITSFLSRNSNRPFPFDVSPDWRVLAFTLAASLLTGVFCGLAPAFRSTRFDLTSSLKGSAPMLPVGLQMGRRFRRIQLSSGLVVAQVALSVVVLVSAGLMVRTLEKFRDLQTGFEANNVLLFRLNRMAEGTTFAGARVLDDQLRERLASVPGVASASYSSQALLSGGVWTSTVRLEGKPDSETFAVDMLAAGPDFLATMRIPLLAGRAFAPEDFESAARKSDSIVKANALSLEHADPAPKHDAAPVSIPVVVPVLVNGSFARKYFANENPLGKGLTRGGQSGASGGANESNPASREWEIVGVIADTKYETLRAEIVPTIYVPFSGGIAQFELRTTGDPAALIPTVRDAVEQSTDNAPMVDVRTQTEQIDRLLVNERLLVRLVSVLGFLALLLACVGLYGLLSYEVARRTREIGVRIALGAARPDVLRLVMGQGIWLALVGIVSGIVVSLAVTRYLQSMLYEVKPSDPVTYCAVGGLILLVASAASFVPTKRAMDVEPMVALRHE